MVILANPFAIDDSLFFPGNSNWYGGSFNDMFSRPMFCSEPMWPDEGYYRQPCHPAARGRNNVWMGAAEPRQLNHYDDDYNDNEDQMYDVWRPSSSSRPFVRNFRNGRGGSFRGRGRRPTEGHSLAQGQGQQSNYLGHQGQDHHNVASVRQQGPPGSTVQQQGHYCHPNSSQHSAHAQHPPSTQHPCYPGRTFCGELVDTGDSQSRDKVKDSKSGGRGAVSSPRSASGGENSSSAITATAGQPVEDCHKNDERPIGIIHPTVCDKEPENQFSGGDKSTTEQITSVNAPESDVVMKEQPKKENDTDKSNVDTARKIGDDVLKPAQTVKKPLSATERLEACRKDLDELEKKVDNFVGVRSDREFIVVEEMITKTLLSLDCVDANGDEEIRQMRKELVRRAQSLSERLENKVNTDS